MPPSHERFSRPPPIKLTVRERMHNRSVLYGSLGGLMVALGAVVAVSDGLPVISDVMTRFWVFAGPALIFFLASALCLVPDFIEAIRDARREADALLHKDLGRVSYGEAER